MMALHCSTQGCKMSKIAPFPITSSLHDDIMDVIAEIESDRCKTGQEIHDTLGHDLAVLVMKTRRYRELSEESHPVQARLFQALEEDINSILLSIRAIINGLIPLDSEEEPFATRLRQYARSLSDNTGLSCRLECEGDLVIADAGVRNQLLRIIQEAVHNALVHACCSEILIRITVRGDGLEALVRDNGVGFDYGTNPGSGGHGQKIMSYRALLIGASLDVTSSPGQGTSVRCRLPPPDLHPRAH
jgi:signal transduction histidine kinase